MSSIFDIGRKLPKALRKPKVFTIYRHLDHPLRGLSKPPSAAGVYRKRNQSIRRDLSLEMDRKAKKRSKYDKRSNSNKWPKSWKSVTYEELQCLCNCTYQVRNSSLIGCLGLENTQAMDKGHVWKET